MFCTQCGAKIPEGARFCPQCRAKIPVVANSVAADQASAAPSPTRQDLPQNDPGAQVSKTPHPDQQMTQAMNASQIASARSATPGSQHARAAGKPAPMVTKKPQPVSYEATTKMEDLHDSAGKQAALNTLVQPGAAATMQAAASPAAQPSSIHEMPAMDKTMAIPVAKQAVSNPSQSYVKPDKEKGTQFYVIAGILGILILVLAGALAYFGYQAYVQHHDAQVTLEAAALKDAEDKEKSKKDKEAQDKEKEKQKSTDKKTANANSDKKAQDAQTRQQSYDTLNSYYETLGTQSSNIANFATSFNAVLDKGKGERGDLLSKMKDYRQAMTKDKDALMAFKEDSSYTSAKDKLLVLASYNERRIDVIIEALDRSMAYSDPSSYHDTILEPLAKEQRAGSSKPEALIRFEDEYPGARPSKP